MKLFVQAFSAPKAGNAETEYEDAFWPTGNLGTESPFRLAVADGATETSFSGLWASLLVQAFGDHVFSAGGLLAQLPALQKTWTQQVTKEPLPWYAEQKLQAGAFAALLGLELLARSDDVGGTWNCTAVGDCCLFQVRRDELVAKFPMQSADDFNSRPRLVSSDPTANGSPEGFEILSSGRWEYGDTFYLMSDAIACWFLRKWGLPDDGGPLGFLRGINTNEGFRQFVDAERADISADGIPILKNDDVTIVVCTIAES